MAPNVALKRVTIDERPSASTSSDEDEQLTDNEEEHQNQEQPKEPVESEPEQESESEEEEEEEEQQQQVNKDKPSALKPNPTTSPTKITVPNSTLDSESGSDSDTNSDQTQPSPNAPDFTIKPIVSKPMTGSLHPKKPTTKPVAKRPLETKKNANESKKKKTKVKEEEKKPGGANSRLWSANDEVVILKSMMEFQSKKGIDPYSDKVGFHEFIQKSLSVDVSKSQLMDKVKRLKGKYVKNDEIGQKGEEPVFSNPHEHKCFELSKKIWGGGCGKESKGVVGIGNGNGKGKSGSKGVVGIGSGSKGVVGIGSGSGSKGVVGIGSGNGKSGSKTRGKNVEVEYSLALSKEKGKGVVTVEGVEGETKDVKVDKVEEFWSMFQCLKQSLVTKMEDRVTNFLMANANVIGNVKATELEKKWKILCLDEAALHLRRVELIQELTKLVVDAMQASKD